MPRNVTGPRLAALLNPRRRTFVRVFVENPDSLYIDVTDFFGINWLDGGRVIENVDQPVPSATITLKREFRGADGTLSMSPTIAGSLINRNSDGDYARFLKAGRGIRIFLGWEAPEGVDNFPADYLEGFRGKIDEVDWKGREGLVGLECRGAGAWLLDKQIEEERIYGDADGVAMETVMQQILDDNESDRLGPVVLYVPVSPDVLLHEFKQDRKSVLEALRDLAFQIGWNLHFRWQADGSYRLELYKPDRTKAVADWTLGPANYFDVSQLKEGDADVRNRIRGKTASPGPPPSVLEYVAEDPDSIGEYDVRYMEFTEDDTSEIDTIEELTSMVDAALADLKAPAADQEIENDWFPVAEVGDLGEWEANGRHYDTDEKMAVVQVRHEFSQTTRRTYIQSRGSVVGGTQEWLRRGKSHVDDIPPDNSGESSVFLGNFRELERQPTYVRFGWQPSPGVAQIWVYKRTQVPSGVEPWPPTAAAVTAGATPVSPSKKLTGNTGDFVVEIPPDGQVTYVQFEPRDKLLQPGDLVRQRVFASEKPPTIETVRQAAGPTGLFTAVQFDIIDAKGLGGELRAWVNANSANNADPDDDPDGTLVVASTPSHIDGSDIFDLTAGGSGTLLHAVKVHPSKQKRVYFEFVNAQGTSSGKVSVTLLTNSSIIDEDGELVDGAIKTAFQFATGITPVQVLSSLPVSAADGTVVLLTTDGQLYRRVSGVWTLAVPAVNITGQIVTAQISDAAISTAKFAAGLRPVRIVAVLPAAGDVQGDTVFLTTDNKLYRWTGSAWTAAVPAVDLTGTIDTAQIADAAITAAKIGAAAVQTANIAVAAITTALIAAANITTTTIADDAITSPKIIAGAIVTAKLAAGAVTANEIAALTITAGQIAAGTITGSRIAAGTITAGNISALTITAAEIAALTITGAKIAANTITAANIAADTITGGEIAAGAITTSELSAGAVTAVKIAAGTITANEIAAATITSAKIAAATITATNIAAGTITSTELSANSIIAGKIAAGAINASSLIVNGVITALKLNISVLDSISNDMGIIVAGELQSINGHSFINLNATGTNPFIYHETAGGSMTLSLLANGNATFGGTVASDTFSSVHASFSGSLTVSGTISLDVGGIALIDTGVTVAAIVYAAGNLSLESDGTVFIDTDGGFSVIDRINGSGVAQFSVTDASAFAGLASISFRWDTAGTGAGGNRFDTIQVGAANSGGAGKRALFINN